MVIIALIWPSPGVSISSASTAAGSSESASGWPETLLCQRPGPEPASRPVTARGGRHRRQREHHPAGPVQVAGQDVDDVDQPAADGAEFDGGRARSGRRRQRWARRRVPWPECGCRRPSTPQCAATVSGAKSRASSRTSSNPATWSARSSERHQVLVEQDVDDGEQQCRVGAGPRRHVPVGELGGAGAGRVDDDQRAAALTQAAQLAGEICGGGQAAVGHQRIRADDHQVVGAVEIGHGERDGAAEHQAAAPRVWASGRGCSRSTPGGCPERGRSAAGTARPPRCGRWGCRGTRPRTHRRARGPPRRDRRRPPRTPRPRWPRSARRR